MRRRYGVSEKLRDKWVKQGFGQGYGANYKSFHRVRDVPSPGLSVRVPGAREGDIVQEHNLLSGLEYRCFMLLRFNPLVRFIYDQYAMLPVKRGVDIAHVIGVSHPTYVGSSTAIVVTTDLVVELFDGSLWPFYVKPASELDPTNPDNIRTLEKLLIERLIWADRGKDLVVLTELNTDGVKASNLEMLFTPTVQPECDYLNALVPEFSASFQQAWSPDVSLRELLFVAEDDFGLSGNNAFKLFSKAVWAHALPIDLSQFKLRHERSVPMLSTHKNQQLLSSANNFGTLIRSLRTECTVAG